MIHRTADYKLETRENMRGGKGAVKIEHLFDESCDLKGAARLCARLTLEPGCSIGFHTHSGEREVFYIVSGEAEMDDNGVKTRMRPGESIATGDGGGHAVESVGREALVMLAMIFIDRA